jgi:hypothetical protein
MIRFMEEEAIYDVNNWGESGARDMKIN